MWTTGKYYWKNVVNTITPKCNTPLLCTLPSTSEVCSSSSLNQSAYGGIYILWLLELFQLGINMPCLYLLADFCCCFVLFLTKFSWFFTSAWFQWCQWSCVCVQRCMDVNQLHLLYFRGHLHQREHFIKWTFYVYSVFAREHVPQLHCWNPSWKSAVVA